MPMSKEKYKEYYKTYYNKNKDKLADKNRAWRKKRPDLYRLAAIRYRCKKEGIPFNITEEDIEIPDKCPILGLLFLSGVKRPEDTSPSVDRIDPQGGYTKGNVQVISNLANKMKANATSEQLLLFADWVYKTYGNKDS